MSIFFLLNHTTGLVLVAQLGASTENNKNSYNEPQFRDDGIKESESIATVGTVTMPLYRDYYS